MANVRWAMVGTGLMADLILRDFPLSENTELVALVSRDAAKADQKLAEVGISALSLSFEQAIAHPEIDLIYIASPHSEHFWMAKAALEAGKHILVEKSFMNSAEEAEEIYALARQKNLFSMEAMWTKFMPLHNELIEIVKSGRIGQLRLIEANFGFLRTFDNNHRLFNKELGGGSSLDQGVYTTTLNRWFADSPIKHQSTSGYNYPNGVDALAMTNFEFENGVAGRGNSSLATALGMAARLVGDLGIIEIQEAFWNTTDSVIKTYEPNSDVAKVENISRPRKGAGYVHMIEAVSNTVLAGEIENPQHTHAFSLEIMRSLDKTRAGLS
jgi:predicted dehydrogenase